MDARDAVQWIVVVLVIVMGACGGAVSAGSVFTYGGEFNLRIPAGLDSSKGWMDDAVMEIPDHFTISDIDIGMSLTHTNVFDLQIFLQSPTGMKICLNMYNPFGEFFKGANYTQTTFDDEAEIPIEQGKPPFTGRFKPRSPFRLSVFNDQDTFGQWKLQIYDAHYYDIGTLNSFELIIITPEPATAMLLTLGTALIGLFRSRRGH